MTVNLWAMLDEEQRNAVRAEAELCRFPAGTMIINEGDTTRWVLILTAGRVKIVSASAGGYDAVLAVRGPGDILGEMAAMDGSARSASAVTIEDVTALRLSPANFDNILRVPGVSAALLRIIAARLRYANARRTAFADSTASGRIATLLVELADQYGRPVADGTLIGLRISQGDLAGLASTSRKAVTRTLHEMREDGLLSTGRQRLVIRSMDGLRLAAQTKAES
jgi:CRP/FNR family cyclic AMP-dependent transcriptional regulator